MQVCGSHPAAEPGPAPAARTLWGPPCIRGETAWLHVAPALPACHSFSGDPGSPGFPCSCVRVRVRVRVHVCVCVCVKGVEEKEAEINTWERRLRTTFLWLSGATSRTAGFSPKQSSIVDAVCLWGLYTR